MDNLKGTIAAGGKLMEVGVSIAPTPLAIVIDVSNVVDEWRQGKYGSAATGALFAFIGGIADVKQAGKSLRVITSSGAFDMTGEIGEIAKYCNAAWQSRAQKVAHVLEKLNAKEITPEQVDVLYEFGVFKLKAKSSHYKALQRHLEQAGEVFYDSAKTRRHHDLPLQFEQYFVRQGIDPDTVGRFLPKEVHKKYTPGKASIRAESSTTNGRGFSKISSNPDLISIPNWLIRQIGSISIRTTQSIASQALWKSCKKSTMS